MSTVRITIPQKIEDTLETGKISVEDQPAERFGPDHSGGVADFVARLARPDLRIAISGRSDDLACVGLVPGTQIAGCPVAAGAAASGHIRFVFARA